MTKMSFYCIWKDEENIVLMMCLEWEQETMKSILVDCILVILYWLFLYVIYVNMVQLCEHGQEEKGIPNCVSRYTHDELLEIQNVL